MKLFGLTGHAHRRNFIKGQRNGMSGFAMSSNSRLFADWTATNITNDSLLASQLLPMRSRARQLARDEDYMKAFLGACRQNVIGPNGVSLQMDVRNPARPQTGNGGGAEWIAEPDDLANDAIEGAWDEFSKPWSYSPEGRMVPHFTTGGRMSRVQFGHLGITTAARDGEFLYRLVRGFDNPFGFAVQPINPDYLDECKNEVLPNGDQIRMGVQKNKWGAVTGYWLRTWNPGDLFWTGRATSGYKSEFVSAEEVRHFYVPDDFELSRGYPWIHAGATRLKMLAGYEEAAIEAARAAACKHEYLEQVLDPNAPAPDYQGDAVDAMGNPLSDLEPGTRELLPRGIKVNAIDPKYPHTEHRPFIVATLTGIAAGLQVSYSTLTGDLSQVNYSSLRAGLLPERDNWTLLQSLWVLQVELPIFLDWLRMALLKGAIKLPNGSALPAARFEKFARPMFQGRRWPWVDPQKDQEANAIALTQRVTSRSAIVAQQGGDFEDTLRAIARDEKLAKKHGVTLPEDQPAKTKEEVQKEEAQAEEKRRREMYEFKKWVKESLEQAEARWSYEQSELKEYVESRLEQAKALSALEIARIKEVEKRIEAAETKRDRETAELREKTEKWIKEAHTQHGREIAEFKQALDGHLKDLDERHSRQISQLKDEMKEILAAKSLTRTVN
jgi:lambda family phage portal protein